jgi:hypothetical protein
MEDIKAAELGDLKPQFDYSGGNQKGEKLEIDLTGPEIDIEVLEELGKFIEWFEGRK